jgi:single-strand DNA-binding protein
VKYFFGRNLAMLNKVILIGRIGRDAELRTISSGSKMATFSLATSEHFKNKNGEKSEKTEWHQIVVFSDNLATIAEKICRKGRLVYIEGALQTRKWKDKDGKERYSTEVVLKSFGGVITVLSGGKDGRSSDRDDDGDSRSNDRASSSSGKTRDDLDDEIPF